MKLTLAEIETYKQFHKERQTAIPTACIFGEYELIKLDTILECETLAKYNGYHLGEPVYQIIGMENGVTFRSERIASYPLLNVKGEYCGSIYMPGSAEPQYSYHAIKRAQDERADETPLGIALDDNPID